MAQSHGLDFQPIRGNVAEVAAGDIAQETMKADNPLKFLRSFNQLKRYTFSLQKDFWAAGLRAGVPVVIIPHGNDQFAWGRRVYELGVGPNRFRASS